MYRFFKYFKACAIYPFFSSCGALLQLTVNTIIFGTALYISFPARAEDSNNEAVYRFNPQLLRYYFPDNAVDITRFGVRNITLPGTYRADFYLNQTSIGRKEIILKTVAGFEDAQPCFNLDLLQSMGVDLNKLPTESKNRLELASKECLLLPELLTGSTAIFDSSEQKLIVTIPQILLTRQVRGYIPPEYWDEGITAASLRYNANVYQSRNDGGSSSTQSFLGLTAGANTGAWRLRHNGNFSHASNQGSNYQSIETYVQRSIEPVKGRLSLGDFYTNNRLFNSFGIRGVRLATDDRMYPESQRGYAPIVRGIANSNARVQIRQNGNVIYETNVAPGSFAIDDLYPSGWYQGDLDVVVTEADGSVHTYTLPFAASINALRPGVTHYDFAIGQHHNQSINENPFVSQMTVQHGLTNVVTLYGGVLYANDYYAFLAGTALNTPLGAFSLDITHANASNIPNIGNVSGQSIRLAYSKHITPTATDIDLSLYYRASKDFLNFSDALGLRENEKRTLAPGELPYFSNTNIDRMRLQATINQDLGEKIGTLYFSGSLQNYFTHSGRDIQAQIGYNNSYKSINYGFYLARQYAVNQESWENRLMFTIGIPLGNGIKRPYSRTTVQYDSGSKRTSVQESISGVAGEDYQISYNLNAGYMNQQTDRTNFDANMTYKAPFATLGAGVSRVGSNTQARLSAAGGVLAYAGGVVLSPDLGETVAIIEARDAVGAKITNANGVKTDGDGLAAVSNLSVFEQNDISIDTKGLPLNVVLTDSTSQRVVPTAGAVVLLKFETKDMGRPAIFRAQTVDHKPLPFGADVLDAAQQRVGTVTQAGKIFVTGLSSNEGNLTVKWGEQPAQQCTIKYSLPEQDKKATDNLTIIPEVLDCL